MSGSAGKLASADQPLRYSPAQQTSPSASAGAARTTALRILHVDDEPDIREVVELSLSLDPAFDVRSCASGSEALAMAEEWVPDLILCDVMMPMMDGPATLAQLRGNPRTLHIPIVFMTARAQTRELEHFKSLGATGVIAKPFDPMTLASSIRNHLRAAGIAALRGGFITRLRADATALSACRADLNDRGAAGVALDQIKKFAHALAGAAGIFGFHEVTRAAVKLEKVAIGNLDKRLGPAKVEEALDKLLAAIEIAHPLER